MRPSKTVQHDYIRGKWWWSLWPPARVINFIILLCVVIHVFTSFMPVQRYNEWLLAFALSTHLSVEGQLNLISYLSHAFLHGSWQHLISNLIWLYAFGQVVAVRFGAATRRDVIRPLGWFVFLSFYFSAIVFSGLVYVLANLTEVSFLVGASGGISALTAGAIRISFRRFQPFGWGRGLSLPVWDWKVLVMTILYIGSNLAFNPAIGSIVGLEVQPVSVAWEAHVAGFLYGLIMFNFFDRLSGSDVT